MGACLSRNNGEGSDHNDFDFRNLNDSRHVMLLVAKKERQRDRAARRGISLSGHADADPAERSGASRHTSATTFATTCTTATANSSSSSSSSSSNNNNTNSQTSITASGLERSDSGRQRSKRSLMQLASGPHKAPSARQNLIDTQKELAKLDSYGEYIPPTAPHSTTTIHAGEEGPEHEAAAASQQAKAA